MLEANIVALIVLSGGLGTDSRYMRPSVCAEDMASRDYWPQVRQLRQPSLVIHGLAIAATV
jgi:hypothetical protein